MRQTPASTTAAAAPLMVAPEAQATRPGVIRRVVRGRRVQVEMLGADGAWSPVFCYNEPPGNGPPGNGQDNAGSR